MKKLEQGRLDNMIAEAAGKVEIGGRYLHYKGNIYRVLDIVISESSQTLLVVYQAEYGRRLKFARDLDDWLEEVVIDSQVTPQVYEDIRMIEFGSGSP